MNGATTSGATTSGATTADLALVIPELILVGMALALILAARRIQRSPVATVGTVLAALAAAAAAGWALSWGTMTGFGGMITVDAYSQFFKVLIAAALALVALLSVRSTDGEEQVPRGEYHALLLLASTGMMLSVSAIDLITLYLGLELTTLCSYILVGITVQRMASNEAAIKYFLLASFASAVLLYGISLTYGVTGSTNFVAISSVLSPQSSVNPLLLVALGLVTAGLAFKIAAVPFHAWTPDAYQGASAPVAGFLATGAKAAGLAVLGRVCLVAFGSETQALSVILAVLAALSIVVGSIIALSQTDMKRLLAYSSIAHVGYALLGLMAGTPEGVSATMTYAFFYVFMTLGAFGVIIALGERGERLDGFRGLAAQRPATAALMLLFLLSLTGIPPTAGFAAKFVVITSAVRADHIALAVLAVVCSVVSAFVYLRVAVLMYMQEPPEPEAAAEPVQPAVRAAAEPVQPAVRAALAVAALVTVIGGIFPDSIMFWAVAP
ncbi:MAG: NADH-quinone oxidoreductase subunit N [Planctomycetes bacterium]|nr:NADH-quinone oxidoreductase subunit N [Planctomycetota bacterium]